jgi:hypothetical protein
MRSLLLDTSLLVLLVVGLCDRAMISRHKRTRTFVPEDFDLLLAAINDYDVLWITSHCLSEASSLLRQTDREQAARLLHCLAAFVGKAKESHISKDRIFANGYALRLGVADAGIIAKSRHVQCVMTADFDLYDSISRLGHRVVNFNHMRRVTLLP